MGDVGIHPLRDGQLRPGSQVQTFGEFCGFLSIRNPYRCRSVLHELRTARYAGFGSFATAPHPAEAVRMSTLIVKAATWSFIVGLANPATGPTSF